ncbi:unnamed protein product [Linum tenue]|uniref:Reverse transcriptase zinc-binding domain-containing protein n=1 Tax=Linum tenue TaxID=586396 RepID=A0AAV0PC60_9ROSI|nr:unnamed protein product [Linum tenue]
MYQALNQERFPGSDSFPFRTVWRSEVPMKVKAFLWLVTHERILTHDNLKRRGWNLASRCALCNSEEENIDHLFRHCSFSSKIWSILQLMIEFHGPFPDRFVLLIRCWSRCSQTQWKNDFASGLLHAFSWEIWKERNARIFHDKSSHWRVILHKICRVLLSWVRAAGILNDDRRTEWLALMHQCCPLPFVGNSSLEAGS